MERSVEAGFRLVAIVELYAELAGLPVVHVVCVVDGFLVTDLGLGVAERGRTVLVAVARRVERLDVVVVVGEFVRIDARHCSTLSRSWSGRNLPSLRHAATAGTTI